MALVFLLRFNPVRSQCVPDQSPPYAGHPPNDRIVEAENAPDGRLWLDWKAADVYRGANCEVRQAFFHFYFGGINGNDP